jgi:hypothetical protein
MKLAYANEGASAVNGFLLCGSPSCSSQRASMSAILLPHAQPIEAECGLGMSELQLQGPHQLMMSASGYAVRPKAPIPTPGDSIARPRERGTIPFRNTPPSSARQVLRASAVGDIEFELASRPPVLHCRYASPATRIRCLSSAQAGANRLGVAA